MINSSNKPLKFTNITLPNFLKKTCIIAATSVVFNAQCFAEDEVFLATLNGDELVSVSNISNRIGYDNQPHFTPDSKELLFTSAFINEENGKQQTDSMRFDIATNKITNLSNSSNASEYSPTVTPDAKNYSIIRVAEDAKQLLWQYPLDNNDSSLKAKQLLDIYDVGYHIWLNNEDLLLFVLGEPMTLQRTSVTTQKSMTIDTNIGRTLRKVPGKELFSYTKGGADGWQVKLFNPKDNSTTSSVTLPNKNMYYAWHQKPTKESGKGTPTLLSAQYNVVMSNNLNSEKWQPWIDFSSHCSGYISRMKMSDNGQYFAFVCVTKDD